MTESRRLRKMRADEARRREEQFMHQGLMRPNDWAEEWMAVSEERLDRLVKAGLVRLGPKPYEPKLGPNEWRIAARQPMFVEPMALSVYRHLEKKYQNEFNGTAHENFEKEFFDIIQKWLDDKSCEDAILGTLELEAESFEKLDVTMLRGISPQQQRASLTALQHVENMLYKQTILTEEDMYGLDALIESDDP